MNARLVYASLLTAWLPVAGLQAQPSGVPGSEHTLTITATGTASASPDWVDVNLPISASGISADAALMSGQDARERTVAALLKAGIKQEQMTIATIKVSGLTQQPFKLGGGPGMRFTASGMIRVRLTPEPDTLYERICAVLDAAVSGEGTAPAEGGMMNVMVMVPGGGGQDSVTFGVNNRSALVAKAAANALEQARPIAELVAAQAGRSLGEVLALQLHPGGDPGVVAAKELLQGLGADPETNGKAVATVTVSVTYRLK